MKYRCLAPTCKHYKNYGGRGIKVCDRWLNSFENFLLDMGRKPSPKHSIDRIDVNGDYEPSNCRWATDGEQMRNIRNNVILTINGISKCATDWAIDMGLSPLLVLDRKRKGWLDKDCIIPTKKLRRKYIPL